MLKVKTISVPAIQRDGRAVAIQIECDNGESIPLLVNTDDLRKGIAALLDALDAAEVTEAVRVENSEAGEQLTTAPIVYQATGTGFVRDPHDGLQYVLVSTATGEHVCIGFESHRLQRLLDQIEDMQSIQTPLEGAPPN
jgi:hypothetical protein